ncbi:hypothetical protein [Kitasatospora sp. NPDC004531]
MASPPPSATSFNYVVRSAIGGLVLAAETGPDRRLPTLVNLAAIAVTALTALARRRPTETTP